MNQFKQIIFVLGRPGSGKGTCCEILAREYPAQIAHLSAGELLRRSSEDDPGSEVARLLAAGQMVPSSVTVGLLRRAIAEAAQPLVLIDGFPRTPENRSMFLATLQRDADAAMLVDVGPAECVRRLRPVSYTHLRAHET